MQERALEKRLREEIYIGQEAVSSSGDVDCLRLDPLNSSEEDLERCSSRFRDTKGRVARLKGDRLSLLSDHRTAEVESVTAAAL